MLPSFWCAPNHFLLLLVFFWFHLFNVHECHAGKVLVSKIEPIGYIQQCPWDGCWVRCYLHRWCESPSFLWASSEAGCPILIAEQLALVSVWTNSCSIQFFVPFFPLYLKDERWITPHILLRIRGKKNTNILLGVVGRCLLPWDINKGQK